MKFITTVPEAIDYLKEKGYTPELLECLKTLEFGDPVWHYLAYRIVVIALTDNAPVSLDSGEVWIPVVQFATEENAKFCLGTQEIGKISYNGTSYVVMGGVAVKYPEGTGIGLMSNISCCSAEYPIHTLLAVPSKEIALHISKYFGMLVFRVLYNNCNWYWKL